jgi:hypothetical protein
MLHRGASLVRWVLALGLLATGVLTFASAPAHLTSSTRGLTRIDRLASADGSVQATPSWQPLLHGAHGLAADSAPSTRPRVNDLATMLGAWLPNAGPGQSIVPRPGSLGALAILARFASNWELTGHVVPGAVPPVALSLLYVVGLRWARSLRGPPAPTLAFRGVASDLG